VVDTSSQVSKSGHQDRISISIFFPCFNEQDNIPIVIRSALEVLEIISADYEIIIIDDGSTDRTAEIARELGLANPRIRLVRHPANLGYGAALRSGFRTASKDLVFFTDADGQFDLRDLPSFLEAIGQYDVVCGYRLRRSDGIIRRFNGWCWTQLVCLLFGLRVRDVDCAFKLFRRHVVENMQMLSNGALISAEILARATKAGFRIAELPVRHYPRRAGRQTGANLRVIIRAFVELWRLRKQILED
jgi:glycosyltransferase involved in cell wall biosynthesis